MVAAPRVRGSHARRLRWSEAETAVEADITQQENAGLVQGVGGCDNPVHQGVPDAAALLRRNYAERAEPQCWLAVHLCAATEDVPNYLVVELGDNGQARNHNSVVPQRVDKYRLGREDAIRTSESRGVNGLDRGSVGFSFPTK